MTDTPVNTDDICGDCAAVIANPNTLGDRCWRHALEATHASYNRIREIEVQSIDRQVIHERNVFRGLPEDPDERLTHLRMWAVEIAKNNLFAGDSHRALTAAQHYVAFVLDGIIPEPEPKEDRL